uniref:non-specific serine/threonine protein kinase n=1 Tax=Anthurium amnicola TaxID=1678845 RepID=A0A1D1Y2H7_9ARAE
MSKALAALLGGAAAVVALVGLVIVYICFRMLHDRSVSRTSETNSSDPSLQLGQNIGPSFGSRTSYPYDFQGATCFMLEELDQATKNFSEINLIGVGQFGEVYKGLLPDMLVAIKRRQAAPSQEFIQVVQNLSCISHRNLVNLLGYCQESDLQMLIYEYITNGSISSHLYGVSHTSNEKLEFKHRLSIACGAAKGLAHLHSLNPPLIHMDFRTSNVLVDENFAPKVADAGLRNLLHRKDGAGPSFPMTADDLFLDPGVNVSQGFTEKSDVYSFGVFLLELIGGQEATQFQFMGSNQSIIEWVLDILYNSNTLMTSLYEIDLFLSML